MADLRQETMIIDGKEYTFQEMPSRSFLKMQNRTQDRFGNPVLENLYDEIFKHIIVEPRCKLDDFSTAELEKLASAAMKFQLGE